MKPDMQSHSESPAHAGSRGTPKVAYIMSRFPKLTETFILYEALALEELGVPVELYPLLRERQAVTHPDAERLLQRAHFHPFLSLPILRAQWHFLRKRPLDYFKLWVEVLRGTWASLNFLLGAVGIFPKAVRFAYEMSIQGITHVHAHFANHPAVAALIIHRLTGIPFSFTAHGSDLHVKRRMLREKVEAAAFVVAISRYNKEFIIRECGEGVQGKIHVVHCGVDVDFFSPSEDGKKRSGPFQILCVGSFGEVKGHMVLIEACRLLRLRGVDFMCHLVGDGPLRRQLEQQIAKTKLKDKMVMHGMLRRADVAKMLRAADLMVLASVRTRRGDREGIPNALMEAMASGLPVVASAISGIRELVESERTGLLVPPGDSAALADALQTLSENADLLKMGQAGREKVILEFNLKASAAALRALFLRGEAATRREISLVQEGEAREAGKWSPSVGRSAGPENKDSRCAE